MHPSSAETKSEGTPLKVWDLPTRLFHWTLVVFVVLSFITGATGGTAMTTHQLSGEVILALLLFRLAWGFVGGGTSRFGHFLRRPAEVLRYAAALIRGGTPRYFGHNPLGGWSIAVMLALLLVQAGTGLFANDDIFIEGPLYDWVTKPTSDLLTRVHLFNRYLLLFVIGVHVAAVFFYLAVKRDNLILPMLTGFKHWDADAVEPVREKALLALVIALLSSAAVYLLVR
ncbi:MAG: cytochrome b/b6 domain-containing protein [Desulfobacterales bacterium]